MPEPIIISSSALQTFEGCKKAFQIGFEMMLEPSRGDETNVIDKGLGFHKYAQYQTTLKYDHLPRVEAPNVSEMTVEVYNKWWEYVGEAKEAKKKKVLGVESPIYTPIEVNTQDGRKVFLRCTFDQIYLDKEGWIVALDYKTFSRFDPWDVDLDFQGRLYTAALQLMFPDYPVRFEYERIRQAAPGTPKGESQNLRFVDDEWWQYNPKGDKRKRAQLLEPHECYETIDLVCSPQEIVTLWEETKIAVADMLATRHLGAWYRQTSKMGCKMCMYKDLCKADLQGTLDEETISILATKRKPFEIPPFLLAE